MSDCCHSCRNTRMHEFIRYQDLVRVTSDCRPWSSGGRLAACLGCGLIQKVIDQTFAADCEAIYGSYQLYSQGGGSEQRIFDQTSGQSVPRSHLVLQHLQCTASIPSSGRILDLGCGSGHFLHAFGAVRPGWKLFGLDTNPKYETEILAVPGAARFYQCSLEAVEETFDLISINHTFEHIPDPGTLLAAVRCHLAPGGMLLVDVPYFPDNPFDLVVADHCSHFTKSSICDLLASAGFTPLLLSEKCICKELLVVARLSEPREVPASYPAIPGQGNVDAVLNWLTDFAQRVRDLHFSSFGIFGTTIAGAWTYSVRAADVDFFVDEDPARAGKSFLDRPVVLPQDMPPESGVFLAFPAETAAAIALRLNGLPVRFALPRELEIPCREPEHFLDEEER